MTAEIGLAVAAAAAIAAIGAGWASACLPDPLPQEQVLCPYCAPSLGEFDALPGVQSTNERRDALVQDLLATQCHGSIAVRHFQAHHR